MVSIIVPVYNAERYLSETIGSVLKQTYTDWELLLIDDCSTDKSREMIRDYLRKWEAEGGKAPRIRLIEKKENTGAADTRNVGLSEARGRYIAFLDADDLWYPDRLLCGLQYMEKYDAGFVFGAYEFGDENAVPTGKAVRVPKKLSYREALSRTVIFTSTVLVDTEKVPKELLFMPQIGSEDTATWWRILKSGVIAYGMDRPLVIYRRPAGSLSSDKRIAVRRIWHLYRAAAKLSVPSSLLHLVLWAFRAGSRRLVDDTVRAHLESAKRFTVVQMSLLGILFSTAFYAYAWFYVYYPLISGVRILQDGYYLGYGLKFYFRGHLLILLIYFFLLLLLSRSGGGMKTGYQRPGSIFTANLTALAVVNLITYLQLTLMHNWLVPVSPMLLLFLIQALAAGIWSILSDSIYRHVFPPRETLILYGEGTPEEELHEVVRRFDRRQDRFRVMKLMRAEQGDTRVRAEILRWYGSVVLCGMEGEERSALMEFCGLHYIRTYVVPEIGDLLLQGTEMLDIFGSPLLEFKEYSIRWEDRILKRMADLLIGSLLLIVSAPVMLLKLAADWLRGRPGIVRTPCITKDGKEFSYYSFADGRWKELPAVFNLLKGDMSVIGPQVFTAKEAERLSKKDPRFFFRYRVKPGLTGYAKLHRGTDTTKMDELRMDIFYIQHYSLYFDLKLLLQSAGRRPR